MWLGKLIQSKSEIKQEVLLGPGVGPGLHGPAQKARVTPTSATLDIVTLPRGQITGLIFSLSKDKPTKHLEFLSM